MPTKSQVLFSKSRTLMPGGVNSPVRAFRAVGGDPLFIAKGRAATMTDVDGRSYIDYVLSWGPLILGHAHPEVVEALIQAAETGTSFGACTPREVEMAERIVEAYPSIERVRLVNSGTEATMSALRVARAATTRDKILKFEGCYHGHGDSLLVKAGSGVATLGLPDSPGVPRALAQLTVTVPFNDPAALEEAFHTHRHEIAAVIVEPVVGNMGCVAPRPGFLQRLRTLTQEEGTLLIFDEVMTGSRVAYGGAQQLYKIDPDLTTLGKVIGGGLPVGAYGGKARLMEMIAPAGPVYQAGTLSGNPLAVAAGLKTLEILRRPGIYERLNSLAEKLTAGIMAEAARQGVPLTVNRVGSMFTAFLTPGPVTDYVTAKKADTAAYGLFFRSLLEAGVYFPPSQFEAAFLSTAHSEGDVAATIQAASVAFAGLRP
jgi:glutamate-1-semialdehyde 2,1-aminomutase